MTDGLRPHGWTSLLATALVGLCPVLSGCGGAEKSTAPEVQPELEVLEKGITPNPSPPSGFIETRIKVRGKHLGETLRKRAYVVAPGHEILHCESTAHRPADGISESACGSLFDGWTQGVQYDDHLVFRWKLDAPSVGLFVQVDDTLWISGG